MSSGCTPSTDALASDLGAIWRLEAARIIARVARLTGDVALAEDCAQDALVAALDHWPQQGKPANPAGWLMQVAWRRGLDAVRARQRADGKRAALSHALDMAAAQGQADDWQALEDRLDDPIGEDLLRLIFTACHPLLPAEARAALTLRLMGGLTIAEIARAYLVPDATIAQRITRAKRSLSAARVPFDVPRGAELQSRLASVLRVLYLMFNEGYTATAGPDWFRPALCEEALRLARVLAALLPTDAEVLGLLALMEVQASRFTARLTPDGEPVLLADQDRRRWDRLSIRRGLEALAQAEALPGPLGPYGLQAAIAACHARATTVGETDWPRIVALYDALVQLTPNPIIDLNRAVAVAEAYGPAEALALVDRLASDPALGRYHLLPAVRGDLLVRLGRDSEAAAAFRRAADLASNQREREFLLRRAAQGPLMRRPARGNPDR